MKTHEKHREESSQDVRVTIFTVSSSKFREVSLGKNPDDLSGEKIRKLVENFRYKIVTTKILDDNIQMIRGNVMKTIDEDKANTILITGGTGISSRDVTIESVKPLFEKELCGFGEIFRYLSYISIGSASHLSRATAGIVNNCVVYCLPGSPDAVDTALKIVLPELPHVIHMLKS